MLTVIRLLCKKCCFVHERVQDFQKLSTISLKKGTIDLFYYNNSNRKRSISRGKQANEKFPDAEVNIKTGKHSYS